MNDALLRITRDATLQRADFRIVARSVSECLADTLGVERASVWLMDETRERLRCIDLYDTRDATHTDGVTLPAAEYPAYFGALELDRAIAAHDAQHDPRTVEFRDHYLVPLNLVSMLDATVRRGGSMIGVVCAESTLSRRWTSGEENFVASVADLASIALEMEERRRAEDALRESEERYRGFIGLSAEGIWRIDIEPPIDITTPVEEQVQRIARDGRYAECNASYAHMHGFEKATDIIGRVTHDLVPERAYEPLIARTVRSGYRASDMVMSRSDSAGQKRWFSLNVSGIVRDGKLIRFWGVQREITDRIAYVTELEHQANHDSLTGLWNREWISRRIETLLKLDAPVPVALLVFDLDRFRDVNDSIGHDAGDTVLLAISRRLGRLSEERGLEIARLGGDEFAVVLEEAIDVSSVTRICEEVLDLLREPFEVEGIAIELSASVGIAMAPEHAADAQTLLRRAEVAMYLAKGELTKYGFYEATKDPHSPRRLTLIAGLSSAIRSGELVLHFQPKVDLATRRVTAFEALVRWQHPTHGLIPPGEFMPWAEKSELIRPLTFHVFDMALRELRRWEASGIDAGIAINLSARNLLDDEAPLRFDGLLRDLGVDPARVLIEITESSMMSDPVRALETLRQMEALGLRFSIDDFGTGYSSLSYLRRLPIAELKIDRSFVSHMNRSAEDRTIVQSTIGLGHNLGLSVTAEGVEDEGTLNALTEMGCNRAQGFFIARPMPSDAIASWLSSSGWSA